ncbi:hypothetical protein EVAR_29164_1 [Eumeta japonica]|uniref:Uncharacterized protein n=1 Tax=Eumeta variegata TaxID=151549 RepID=A0A4C1VDL0_EUMVA|nr:hypothetical protein EVAR_29164_1 [Eumeta japonica]
MTVSRVAPRPAVTCDERRLRVCVSEVRLLACSLSLGRLGRSRRPDYWILRSGGALTATDGRRRLSRDKLTRFMRIHILV